MVTQNERTRIYFWGGDDSSCTEAFRHFPGAAIQPVADEAALRSQIGRPDDLDGPRCLVWSLPLSSGLATHRRLRLDGIAIPSVALIDPAEAPRNAPPHFCETAFVLRPGNVPTIVEEIRNALRLDAALLPTRRQKAEFQKQVAKLSTREAEVLELLISGRSTKEIGHELYIGTQTVLKHRANVLKKLGTRNDVELTLKVRQHRDAPACQKLCELGRGEFFETGSRPALLPTLN